MNTWDVRTATGEVVTDLAGLADALGLTPEAATKHLLGDIDLLNAAPEALQAEVKGKPKPGGGTPPPISNGSFVSFSGGKGRVDLIVTRGKVPGVEDDVEGTAKSPAARVVVWEDGKATRKKRGFSTHTLKRIAPLDKGEKADPASALVSVVTEHEHKVAALGLPPFRRVSGVAVKAVYDRGLRDYPGEAKTVLDQTEWALGRVEHFVKVAAGEADEKCACHDLDLLDPNHPLRVGSEKVYLDPATVDETIRSLQAAAEAPTV